MKRLPVILITCLLLLPLCAPASGERAPSTTAELHRVQAPERSDQPRPLERITLQLMQEHQFKFAGFYAAVEKGFYRKHGLEVEIRAYREGLDVTEEVLSGRAEYGLLDNTLITDRLHNKPVVLLASYFKRKPLIIASRIGHHDLDALKGRRLVIPERELNSPLVRLAFKSAGIKPGINIDIVPRGFDLESFVRGEVEAMAAFRPEEYHALVQSGTPFQAIDLAAYLPVPGGGGHLFTSEQELERDLQRALNFVHATEAGWAYALKHPEEILALIQDRYAPRKGRDLLQFEAAGIRQLVMPAIFPVGAVLEERIYALAEALFRAGLAPGLQHFDGFVLGPENSLQPHIHNAIEERSGWQGRRAAQPGTGRYAEIFLTEEERRWLQEHPVLHMAFNPLWAPVEFMDSQGNHRGISADYLARLEELLNVTFEKTPVRTAAEVMALIAQKRLDLMPTLTRTAARERFMRFTEPYLEMPAAIFSAEDVAYVAGLENLVGEKVAVVRDYVVYQWLQQDYPQLELLPVIDVEEGLRRVVQGEAFAFIGGILPTNYYIGKMRLQHVKVVGETPYRYELSMAVRKDLTILAGIMDKALQAIPQEEWNSIYHKWVSTRYDHVMDFTLLRQILAVAVLVLLIILYWNRRLAKEVARRRQAEMESQDAYRYLQGVTDAIGDGVMALDEEGICTFVNPATERLLGWSREELLGKNLCRVARQAEICTILNNTRRGQTYRSEEEVLQRKDGRFFPISITAVPLAADSKGGMVAVFQDITERKKTEEMLRKLSTAVEQSPASIVITDKDGRIEYVNPQFEQVTGYTREEAIGKNPRILKSGRMPASAYADLWSTITRGEIWNGELCNRNKAGELCWELAAICPIKNDAGEITHFIAVKENISLLKLREEELHAAKEAADAANQAKGEFLANMSHEIRTPMNAIIGMGQLLQDTELTEEQREYLQALCASSKSLLGVINDILDFSKIEAGKVEIQFSEFCLDELLQDLFRLMDALAREKGLTLSLSTPEIPCPLIGDPLRLKQVLINLISNALKFTEEGGVALSVKILKQEREQLQLQFHIRDTGIGIALEQQQRLFQPFTQVDSSHTRRHGGTGLGLTISRQLVELMGGQIWVESEPGRGSNFFFMVECGLAAASCKSAPALPERAPAHALPPLQGARVLLVEDDPLNQIVAQRLLESCGVEVILAKNGREAVEAVRRQPFSLVLMDVQMPELDGYQATIAIRKDERFKALPIIAMTAHAMVGQRERCLAAGMNDYFPKPFELEELKRLLVQWVPLELWQSESQTEIQTSLEKFIGNMGAASALVPLDAVLELVPERLGALLDALAKEDWETAKKQAHRLKGSLNIYGSKRLAELLDRIESGVDLVSDAESLAQSVEAEFNLVLKLVQGMRDKLSGP